MSARTFDAIDAKRSRLPLWTALVGPQKSGKTYSALEFATGIQKVIGGDIYLIDTEAGRGLHYADFFKYKYVSFPPPHGPLDYLAAIDSCVKKKAGPIIIDSMTHEHSGEGGVMDRVEKFLDEKCGDNFKRREQLTALAHIKPKAERKLLNRSLEQFGNELTPIFCYRAEQKMKYKTGEPPKALGWQPDTTSPLFYQMTVSFLLPAYSNGVPVFGGDIELTAAEKLFISVPEQFRGWFKPGMRITREVGERMMNWAIGGEAAAGKSVTSERQQSIDPDRQAMLDKILAHLKAKYPGDDEASRQSRQGALYDLGLETTSWKKVANELPIEKLQEVVKKIEDSANG